MTSRTCGGPLVACLLLLCILTAANKATHSESEQQRSLQQLFSDIDTNGDGQLDAEELGSSARSFDAQEEGWNAAQAVSASQEALDGPDVGNGVSEAELQAHLHALMQDHRVVDWVTHGLNLPQYARAFKQNAITALDFPLLVADGGRLLAEDLGVTSKLHQQQILRGLQRLILGLGELPSQPQLLECSSMNRSAVRVTWRPPAAAGHPAMHKFVLQRQGLLATAGGSSLLSGSRMGSGSGSGSGAGSTRGGSCAADTVAAAAGIAGAGANCSAALGMGEGRWEVVGEPDDEDVLWVDLPPAKGSYQYRLAAWSAYGTSPFVYTTAACTVRHPQKQPPAAAAAALPQLPAAAAGAAGGGGGADNLSGGLGGREAAAGAAAGGGADRGTWSWSAVSSAAVVTLTVLLKASQLRIGGIALAHLRRLFAQVTGRQLGGHPGAGETEHEGSLAHRSLRHIGGSSSALAALAGGEPGAAEQQQQQLLMMTTHDSLQRGFGSAASLRLLGGANGEPSSSLLRLEAVGSGLTAGAGEVGDGDPEALAAAEKLQEAVVRGTHCGHPGCHRRFDRLRDMSRKLQSHYCCMCQLIYCLQHTRISPHGPRGGCGLESKCVCHACFAELAPAQQAVYERINRLPKPTSNGSTAAAAVQPGGHAELAAPCAVDGNDAEALPGDGTPEQLSTESSEAAAEPGASVGAAPGVAAHTGTELKNGSGSAARLQWKKAGSVLRALVRFKAAGGRHQHSGATDGGGSSSNNTTASASPTRQPPLAQPAGASC